MSKYKQVIVPVFVTLVGLAIVLWMGLTFFVVQNVHAQSGCDPCPPCDTSACAPCGVCCGSFRNCDGGPGGETPPQPPPPTHPPGEPGDPDPPGDDPPPPTTVSGPPVAVGCGNWVCDPGESCFSCPSDCRCNPTSTPPSRDLDDNVTTDCTPYSDCTSGWARVTMGWHMHTRRYYVVDVVCLPEEMCVPATPIPGVTPEPEDPGHPCQYEPEFVDGFLRQPCIRWPGWNLDVTVLIPASGVLRNPWPRGIVGQPNCLWYLGSSDAEDWSDEVAVPCPNASPGVRHDEPSFDCGNGEIAGEGTQANYQVGAAWRQWKSGDDPVLGYTPPSEMMWQIHDREWNGGTVVDTNPSVCYTFETSSYGLDELGPQWNPDCQDEDCTCDERVLDYLGAESYMVDLITYWYPEYSFRWDEYVCTSFEWSDCGCHGTGKPQFAPTRDCTAPPGICIEEGEWYGSIGQCEEWGWVRRQEPWEIYDLREYGFGTPVYPWTAVNVAGADSDGTRCGSWVDRWPCYIPIPVLELQPQGTGWED